jgi:hypothetical protein
MRNPRDRTVEGVAWRILSLARSGDVSLGFAYTFFNQDGYRTASHIERIFRDVWARSVYNRIDRWVMVTVNASTDDEETLAAFLVKLKGAMGCWIR